MSDTPVVVKTFTQKDTATKSRYAKFLDGRIWRVKVAHVPGVKDLLSLKASLHTTARRLQLRVTTRTLVDENAIEVQARPAPPTVYRKRKTLGRA